MKYVTIAKATITNPNNHNCVQNWANLAHELGLDEFVWELTSKLDFEHYTIYAGNTGLALFTDKHKICLQLDILPDYENKDILRYSLKRWNGGTGNDIEIFSSTNQDETLKYLKNLIKWRDELFRQ